jgi:post-segregation antitoxin (ccd killing protein)
MRLLNVRLDDEDARLVRTLRDRGVSISNVVRAALRAEAKQVKATSSLNAAALLAEMTARFPAPAARPSSRRVNSADRRQVQAVIRQKLGRRT